MATPIRSKLQAGEIASARLERTDGVHLLVLFPFGRKNYRR
jgi:hypothetical protein